MANRGPATVVIGLDGAHFEILDSWLSAGRLPNISRVLDAGVTGDMRSVLPPVTSPNWKAYATGKNPGRLGLFWWENIDVENRTVYYPSERKHSHTEYWELLEEKENVGVLGVPTTHPPKSVGEFLVSGAPDGENTGFAHPSSMDADLRERYDYRVVATNKITEQPDRAPAELLDLIDLRFEVALDLFEEHDLSFLQVTTFYLNTLQHYFWDGEYTQEAWERIDAHVGEFLDRDLNIVLMSDHGSTRIDYSFNINTWLEAEGYLSTDLGVSKYLHRAGLTSERLGALASRLGLRSTLARSLPEAVLGRLPSDTGGVSKSGKAATVDWDDTRVIASGQGPVYLTVPRSDPEFESLRTELIERLEDVRAPDGQPIADRVVRTEEEYHGEYLDEAPAILVEQRDGIHITGDVGRSEVFSEPSDDGWLAENKRDGLFAATGPDFATGTIEDLSILDLAPTLLHLHAMPVLEDMDGTVKKQVFDEDSPAVNRDVETTTVDDLGQSATAVEQESDLSDRLEDLGYL